MSEVEEVEVGEFSSEPAQSVNEGVEEYDGDEIDEAALSAAVGHLRRFEPNSAAEGREILGTEDVPEPEPEVQEEHEPEPESEPTPAVDEGDLSKIRLAATYAGFDEAALKAMPEASLRKWYENHQKSETATKAALERAAQADKELSEQKAATPVAEVTEDPFELDPAILDELGDEGKKALESGFTAFGTRIRGEFEGKMSKMQSAVDMLTGLAEETVARRIFDRMAEAGSLGSEIPKGAFEKVLPQVRALSESTGGAWSELQGEARAESLLKTAMLVEFGNLDSKAITESKIIEEAQANGLPTKPREGVARNPVPTEEDSWNDAVKMARQGKSSDEIRRKHRGIGTAM